jgi:hypothetical protein
MVTWEASRIDRRSVKEIGSVESDRLADEAAAAAQKMVAEWETLHKAVREGTEQIRSELRVREAAQGAANVTLARAGANAGTQTRSLPVVESL